LIAAQDKLKKYAAKAKENKTYFIGAWTNYGFHEDGVTSGLEVAKQLGVEMFDIRRHARPAPDGVVASVVTRIVLWILGAILVFLDLWERTVNLIRKSKKAI
jgi:predicted NAD/FAD-binding protein